MALPSEELARIREVLYVLIGWLASGPAAPIAKADAIALLRRLEGLEE